MSELISNTSNYKKLLSYQKTDVIYQLTYYFLTHFMIKSDRTYDQMLQASRSGKQNIVEGSAASATSAKTEIKLLRPHLTRNVTAPAFNISCEMGSECSKSKP